MIASAAPSTTPAPARPGAGPPAPAAAATSTPPAPLAAWQTRHPWLWALVLSFGGLILTAVGAGIAQTAGLAGAPMIWTVVAFVAVSAALGLLVMVRSRPTLADYGIRPPRDLDRIGWGLPLVLVPPLVVLTAGLQVTLAEAVAYAALTVAVGVNEEVWFRGLVQAALRSLGERRAVIGGALVFGMLHLVNAAGGKGPLYLVLQAVFAAEVGLVLGAIVVITRSLWVGIGWHVVYDFSAYCSGDSLEGSALVGVVAMMVLLAGYAGWLWRRLPAPAADDAPSPGAVQARRP